MAAVPEVPVIVAGPSTLEQMQQLADVVSFLRNKPAAVLRQTVAQSIPNGTFTAITFDGEDLDNVAGHTTTSRYTVQYPGWYQLGGVYAAAPNASNGRGCRWYKNGIDVAGSESMLQAVVNSLNHGQPAIAMLAYGETGDYFEMAAWQSSGGALNSVVSSPAFSQASIAWAVAAA